MADEETRGLLKQAMAFHSRGEIDAALATAEQAVTRDPFFGEGWAYIGNTLVTRKRMFADGLDALERAAALCPHDAAIYYTLGWCREFAANALDKPKRSRPHQPVPQDAATLYAMAKAATLLLDFDGIVWEGTWAGRTPGTVPAYDLDGDPSTFTAAEVQDIHHVWTRVAEAYRTLFTIRSCSSSKSAVGADTSGVDEQLCVHPMSDAPQAAYERRQRQAASEAGEIGEVALDLPALRARANACLGASGSAKPSGWSRLVINTS